MRTASKLSAAFFGLAGIATVAQADVGVLDKYECHKHKETKEYHCHGPDDLAKLGGFVLGADTRIQGWTTSSEDIFLFAGVAVNAEYNHKMLAVTASYFIMPLVNSVDGELVLIDTIYQQGWEAGFKFGPGVGRLGSKAYIAGGWSSADITDTGNSAGNGTISGYYAGVGAGFNTQTIVFDVMASYRDPSSVVTYLEEQQGETYDVTNFDTRVSLGWRF